MNRVGDILIACLLLAITGPLMLVVAIAIRCESAGPILERHARIGAGGRRFRTLQFRTTAHDPGNMRPPWAQATTPLGRLLRYTRIEHLPELLHVLRGDMGILDTNRRSLSFLH